MGDAESNLVRKLRCLGTSKVVIRNQVGLEAGTTNKCQWTQVTLGVHGLTMSKHMLTQIPRSPKSLGTDETLFVLRRMSLLMVPKAEFVSKGLSAGPTIVWFWNFVAVSVFVS
jgi:hypothetical protein